MNLTKSKNATGHTVFNLSVSIPNVNRHPAFVADVFNHQDGYFYQQIKRMIPHSHYQQLDTISHAIVFVDDSKYGDFVFQIIDDNKEEATVIAAILINICESVHTDMHIDAIVCNS